MREKNIRRAARALYLSQGDDKNKVLAKRIEDKEVREVVEDQGRVLVLMEKLLLPKGVYDYSREEMEKRIRERLEKHGHRIQGDNEEDTEEYAKEKADAIKARSSRVPELFGVRLADLEKEEKKQEESVDVSQTEKDKARSVDVLTAVGLPVPPELEQEVATIPQATGFTFDDLRESFQDGIKFGLKLAKEGF